MVGNHNCLLTSITLHHISHKELYNINVIGFITTATLPKLIIKFRSWSIPYFTDHYNHRWLCLVTLLAFTRADSIAISPIIFWRYVTRYLAQTNSAYDSSCVIHWWSIPCSSFQFRILVCTCVLLLLGVVFYARVFVTLLCLTMHICLCVFAYARHRPRHRHISGLGRPTARKPKMLGRLCTPSTTNTITTLFHYDQDTHITLYILVHLTTTLLSIHIHIYEVHTLLCLISASLYTIPSTS